LRSVGWIGREFFVTATYKIPTPDAQCLGTQEFEYAIYPHSGKWEPAKPWIYAHNFNAPLEVIETDLHSGNLPASFSLFSVEPDEVVVSAVKKAENDSAMVVRMFNISDRQVVAKLTAFKPIKSATLVNMLEEPLEDLSVSDNSLSLPLKRNQIVTLKLVYG
jgi:alpha-mannosidase